MLPPGTQIGPYQIDRELGRGGMGVVYAGRDTRLDRPVAIKSLPPELAGDEAVRTRFEREAKALAGLSHPNIAAVYGLEEQGGARYIVMELVDGETLTARLGVGRMAVEDALGVCAQVAAAIEAAHERGVIHRDIKPGNIMIAPDGRVKVLDFGLARQVEARRSGTRAAADVTVKVSPATQIGKVVGTPGYMSPEQCRGKPLDRRTDLWSLGCVLYECLCGEMAFGGETENDCVAAVLEREPDWARLPDRTPVRVRELVKHCLEKDPSRRMRDAGDARLELERAINGREWTTTGAMTAATGRSPGSGRWVRAGLVAAALALAGAGAGWLLARRTAGSAAPPQVFHVSVPIIAKPKFMGLVGISPDARFIVYRGVTDVTAESNAPPGVLVARRLDRDETKAIEGTEGAMSAALSADGRWLAFVAARDRGGRKLSLKKVPLKDGLAAGPPATLGDDVPIVTDVAWASDRELVLWTNVPEPTLRAVSSDGGPTRVVAQEAADQGLRGWSSPSALPGGRQMLISHWEIDGKTIKEHVEVIDLASGSRRTVLDNAGEPRYLPTGHLLALRNTTLIASPFDLSRMETAGGAVAILGGVGRGAGASCDMAGNGALAWVGQKLGARNRRLAWVDEHGQATPIPGPAREFDWACVSPDGGRIACILDTSDMSDLPNELWVLDTARGTMTRLPMDGLPAAAAWTPDGRRITYTCTDASNIESVWERNADGTGDPVRLYKAPDAKAYFEPEGWTPDGSALALWWQQYGGPKGDIWLLRRPEGSGEWTAAPYLSCAASEGNMVFSPDGHWACHGSDVSGRGEMYLQRFSGSAESDSKDAPCQVSSGGAAWALWWSSDGKEIRYLDQDKNMMSVSVRTEPTPSVTPPKVLYNCKGLSARAVTFAPDGRLVAVLPGEGEQVTRVELVLDFFDELKQKLSAAGER